MEMYEPSKEELTAIEEELLEEQGRNVEWESRADWEKDNSNRDWFAEKETYIENLDNHIIRQND